MRLLVVTPTLGRSRWLEQSVASVAAIQTGAVRIQHLLVTPSEQVAVLAACYPAVTILSEQDEAQGLYQAVNYGARKSSDWDWMTYLNDDDVLGPGFEQSLEAAANDSADVIYGRGSYIDAEGQVLGAFPVESQPRRLASLMAAGIPPFTQQGTLVRRACFDRLKGFDPQFRLAADFDFWVRAVRAGCSFCYLPFETGSFRLRKGQLSTDQESVQSELETIVANHLPRPGRVARALVRIGFRLRHGPEIVARRLRSGNWRTVRSIGGEGL